MNEDQITNIIRSIAQVAGIQNEKMVRKAALKVADEDLGISREIVLERLYFFLADGQERRLIVVKFRENIEELDREAWNEDMEDIQQMWREHRLEGDESPPWKKG